MSVYLTSDFHLGHRNICKYRPRFKTTEEHDEFMFSLLETLPKRALVFMLGDFLFDGDHYDAYIERLSKLDCRIRLVLGNHDSLKLMNESIFEHREPLTNYKSMWLSHCPIHPQEMRGRKLCVHGHLHSEIVLLGDKPDLRYFNVNIEDNNYELVPLDTIKNYLIQSSYIFNKA
jgi:calcineurin-like phosphoesterase family protein